MTDTNSLRFFWHRLFLKAGVGPRKLAIAAHKLAESPFDATKGRSEYDYHSNLYYALLSEFGIGFKNNEYDDETTSEVDRIAGDTEIKIDFLFPGAAHYPGNLLQLADALSFSPVFYTMGNTALLTAAGVGVAGARNASPVALDTASNLASEMANHGVNIVSGLARGVDMAAQLGALDAEGTTTAVVPFGLLSDGMRGIPDDFARANDVLFVSMFAHNARFSPANAFARNRLICALSRAFVVVESGAEIDENGRKSGTFDAARQAFKIGIPVFVLSPAVFESAPQGNIELIKLGAREFDIRHGASDIIETVKAQPLKIEAQRDTKIISQTSLF